MERAVMEILIHVRSSFSASRFNNQNRRSVGVVILIPSFHSE